MGCLRDTYHTIEAHPWSRPILVVISIIALAVIISLITIYHGKIKNYFIDLFDNPDHHSNGIKIFIAVIVISVVGPLFAIHFCHKKKKLCFKEK